MLSRASPFRLFGTLWLFALCLLFLVRPVHKAFPSPFSLVVGVGFSEYDPFGRSHTRARFPCTSCVFSRDLVSRWGWPVFAVYCVYIFLPSVAVYMFVLVPLLPLFGWVFDPVQRLVPLLGIPFYVKVPQVSFRY